jgi:hypothetical protein
MSKSGVGRGAFRRAADRARLGGVRRLLVGDEVAGGLRAGLRTRLLGLDPEAGGRTAFRQEPRMISAMFETQAPRL